MNSSKDGTSKTSWFWGLVLSLFLHAIIFSLAIFWGFGSPKQQEETQFIEGRLVSPSELGQSLKGDTGPGKKEEKVKAPPPEKPEMSEEPKKAEVKEESKKAELKREEPPQKVEEEKPKDAIALETKKKKQVAEIPKPTLQPRVLPKEVEKPKEPSFKDVRNKVLEDMRKVRKGEDKEKERQRVLSEIEKKKILKDIEEGRLAEANTSDQERGTSKGSAGYNRQSPGARAALGALFINRVREEIKGNWRIPEHVPVDGSLRTVVVFRIDEGGRVHDVKVEKSSGNPAFDDYCVKAIYRASPLTPPPSELLEEAKTDGVEVPFTNDQS